MRLRSLILVTLAMTALFTFIFTTAVMFGNEVACAAVVCAP